MRAQASKTTPNKGAASKTPSKTKRSRKKTVSKKIKKVVVRKPLVKATKKNAPKNDGETKADDKTESHLETRSSTSKPSTSQNVPLAKKTRKDPNEKKNPIKILPKTTIKKPNLKKRVAKKPSAKPQTSAKPNEISDESKYKINKEEHKKRTTKYMKAKAIVKKGKARTNQKKSNVALSNQVLENENTDEDKTLKENSSTEKNGNEPLEISEELTDNKDVTKSGEQIDIKESLPNLTLDLMSGKESSTNQPETPKQETERPPKFFTSSRSPRMVDIDVKCCKNSKGNLSVSERVSIKCDTKAIIDNNATQNTLVSQGPDIDVYTFSEKVDSPKSILSDFRNPINKNIGRVRPIARVKGTVVDKKTDSERKKFSPHRPIEEVVKQLKAKKGEEVNVDESSNVAGNFELNEVNVAKEDVAPKPLVSKSYKMVARKSSVTGIPFSPLKFLDQDPLIASNSDNNSAQSDSLTKKPQTKVKKGNHSSSSDEELESSKFSLNTHTFHYSSSDECLNESNDETKESSSSHSSKNNKPKNKRYKKITDSAKKTKSTELKELSKDSLVDLKDDDSILGSDKKSKRRNQRPRQRPLHDYWNHPKKPRMAYLNAQLVNYNLLKNEFKTNTELGLMKTVAMQPIPSTSKKPMPPKKKEKKPKESEKHETTSESEYENAQEKKQHDVDDSSESSDDSRPQRPQRGVPGIRSAGKYWDPNGTSSSEDSEIETKKKKASPDKKKPPKSSSDKSDSDKPPAKMKKTVGVPVKKKRNRNEVNMDFKDMVVQKRMASLNASAILAISYEKRSPKSNRDETTTDSGSDESFSQNPKNGVTSGSIKTESKNEEPKKEPECEEAGTDSKQNVEVIVNQDTDVTITGVYSSHSHHHEGFCTVSGLQYRISSTSHTQTTATANCEKEGCSREDGVRYTPLSALSSMQPPAEHVHHPQHTVPELGGLNRRAGCSSAFSAPSPSAHHDPGYYQPAGPLIKETSNEDRALARYHPPHYHAPHPQMLPQYGPPYYPDLCYGRYYRPPGPYPMPPPQGEAPMGGIGGEPYPPPQYYGTPPCYQHSPQRIPYVEYRGCPCPLNACPKNVLIGPATGKAPAGAGPDVPSALAPPGGAFRTKVRACALESAADAHGSGKDPPLEPEPPAGADVPHACPIPVIGGASPKRELFDVRDNIRIASEVHGPGEAIGPPSPARGSAGVCAPQPPPSAPRRARLGKDMARRSLADTAALLAAQPPNRAHSDADDDVVEISSPPCAPIDLSSSDERTTPLVDIKKENEGPTFASARKPDAQALREHNSTTADTNTTQVNESPKAVKRRYSRPKLDIDMKDTQLEEGCKTNGIGEHVKLIKRRKVSGDPPEPPRVESIAKETKKKSVQQKRTPKSPPAEKKIAKRKLDKSASRTRVKKILLEAPSDENPKVNNSVMVSNGVQLVMEKDDLTSHKPKTKSALLLDNLIRKNSIDRADAKGYASDKELNPAELFLSPIENIAQNCTKKTLNINNNIVENANTHAGVRPNTIAAVTQHIEKKLAYKNACKVEKVDSKVMYKSVLKSPTAKPVLKEDSLTKNKCDLIEMTKPIGTLEKETPKPVVIEKEDVSKDKDDKILPESTTALAKDDVPAIEKPESQSESDRMEIVDRNKEILSEPIKAKRCKLSATGEMKAKNVEKVVKLLVSKRPAVKTDEATLVVEEACASPVPSNPRRARRGRGRKGRRLLAPPAMPTLDLKAPPRWSNGWNWDGDHHLSKVYLNNDSRLDRMARCWSRMTHSSGDKVARGDCVLLRASVARAQPFVARVASMWENPEDGEMMVSLVWYYRPEHTDRGRQPADAPDEVFASRHRDANSVACIEDKCYVLTFNEYCRYRKRLKAAEEGLTITPKIVPPMPASDVNPAYAPMDAKLPPTVSPELVLFCRKIYDFRSKKIHMPNK